MSIDKKGRIVLREWERLRIGRAWDREEKTIGEAQANQLELYQHQTGQNLFQISRSYIQAKNYVGSIGIGSYCLDVVPKIDSGYQPVETNQCMANLLYMVSTYGELPFNDTDIAGLANSGKPLVVAFLELYVDNLTTEWRKGHLCDYIAREENRAFLKGKLLFTQHSRSNMIHKERFFTRSDEFIGDNSVTQVLKAALFVCLRQRNSDRIATKAKILIPEFDEVTNREFSGLELTSIQTDRRHARFEKLIRLAKTILIQFSLSQAHRSKDIYSLMFDMNDVFEKYIAIETRRALMGSDFQVTPQYSGKSLLRDGLGRSKFQLRPDICVKKNGQIVAIIDTKWKLLDPSKSHDNVSQSDIYQMYAYGKEYSSPLTILLYPKHGSLSSLVNHYTHNRKADEPEKAISICTVDVSQPIGNYTNRNRLRTCLKNLIKLPMDSESRAISRENEVSMETSGWDPSGTFL